MSEARFVIQLHDATTLHFDLRLQVGDVLRSWAVPKGPSLDPAVRRLAVPVADHTLGAGAFEGVHEGHGRGTGAVIIWDQGRVTGAPGRAPMWSPSTPRASAAGRAGSRSPATGCHDSAHSC